MKFSIFNFQFSILFLVVLLGALIFSPLISFAQYKGLVPCGCAGYTKDGKCCAEIETKNGEVLCKKEGKPCEFCDFFVLFKNIIDFLLMPRPELNQGIPLVPLIAILMIVIGGVMFMLAHVEPIGNPAWIPQAQSLMRAVVFGLILIYGAWLIVGLFLQLIGLAESPYNWYEFYHAWWKEGFFKIKCP